MRPKLCPALAASWWQGGQRGQRLCQSPCSGRRVTFFLLDKSQALGKGVCGEKLPHNDAELWEGVSFPELVLGRLGLCQQGKAAWKD